MKFKPSHRDFYSVPTGRLKISKFAPAETFKSAKPRMATGASNPVTQRRVRAPGPAHDTSANAHGFDRFRGLRAAWFPLKLLRHAMVGFHRPFLAALRGGL
jgi:hypothetical protein